MKILKENYNKEGRRWLAEREELKRELLARKKDSCL